MWGEESKGLADLSGASKQSTYTPLYDGRMLDDAIKHWVNILKAAPTSSRWE